MSWKQTLPLTRSEAPSCGSRTSPQAKVAFTIGLLPDRGLLLELVYVRQFTFTRSISKVLFRFAVLFFPSVSGPISVLAFAFPETLPETSFTFSLRALHHIVISSKLVELLPLREPFLRRPVFLK